MSTRTIYITEYDHLRLRQLINEAGSTDYRGSEYLENLELELEKSKVVTPKEVPPDVVTMNTKVRLVDLEENDEMEYTLVFPDQADLSQNKISVLAPLGTAMLGYREGDTFSFKTPRGEAKMKVKEIIYQPEASGDYHL
jgi:regulator of nucleoside diphosphate kinase